MKTKMLTWCTIIVLAKTVYSQSVQLVPFQATDATKASQLCVQVINQNVSCDPVLADVADRGLPYGVSTFMPSSQLASLCTTACSSSLATWQRRIGGACGNSMWPSPDGGQFVPAALAEKFIEVYNSMCLKNK